MYVDVVTDVSRGDCAKTKIVNSLIKQGGYTHVCRVNGSCNAGHTFYFNDRKIVTHQVPAGAVHRITSLIASGCVVDPRRLFEEIDDIKTKTCVDVRPYLKIAYNAHIVTPEHVAEDEKYDKIGSTKRGIMPAYRAKYEKSGLRAEDVSELKEFICDPINDLWFLTEDVCEDFDHRILVEGAQGFYLDIDHGDYPFVTSSPTTSAYALHSLGLPPQLVRNVYGAGKAYETYVGAKSFQPPGEVFKRLQEVGKEFGSTTGRSRQTNWLHFSELKRACAVNGVTTLIISKMDVLRELNEWKIRDTISGHNVIHRFESEEGFRAFIVAGLPKKSVSSVINGGSLGIDVVFSDSPRDI